MKTLLIGNGEWSKNVLQPTLKQMGKDFIVRTRDYREALLWDEITDVIVATPAQTHFQIARDAILAGKNVLIEKPAVTSLSQAQTLKFEAEMVGVYIAMNTPYSYHTNLQNLSKESFTEIKSIRHNPQPEHADGSALICHGAHLS